MRLPEIRFDNLNKTQLLLFILIVVGLILGVYLVGQRTFFKPKASGQLYNSFEVTNDQGQPLECRVETDPATGGQFKSCDTKSLDVQFKISNIQKLIEE